MKKNIAPALLLISIAVLVIGCSRRQRSEEVAVEPPAQSQPQRTTAERTITLNSQRQTAPPPASPAIRESRPVQQRDQLLSLRGGEVYSPEDFEIGELQSQSDDIEVRLVLSRIQSFHNGLAKKNLPLEDIHPDWREQAQRNLGFHLERGNVPLEVRIGVVDIYLTGKARANIRLIGSPGVAFGEIYLDKFGDDWLVSDLQADMADLAEVAVEREGLYEPSIYRLNNLP